MSILGSGAHHCHHRQSIFIPSDSQPSSPLIKQKSEEGNKGLKFFLSAVNDSDSYASFCQAIYDSSGIGQSTGGSAVTTEAERIYHDFLSRFPNRFRQLCETTWDWKDQVRKLGDAMTTDLSVDGISLENFRAHSKEFILLLTLSKFSELGVLDSEMESLYQRIIKTSGNIFSHEETMLSIQKLTSTFGRDVGTNSYKSDTDVGIKFISTFLLQLAGREITQALFEKIFQGSTERKFNAQFYANDLGLIRASIDHLTSSAARGAFQYIEIFISLLKMRRDGDLQDFLRGVSGDFSLVRCFAEMMQKIEEFDSYKNAQIREQLIEDADEGLSKVSIDELKTHYSLAWEQAETHYLLKCRVGWSSVIDKAVAVIKRGLLSENESERVELLIASCAALISYSFSDAYVSQGAMRVILQNRQGGQSVLTAYQKVQNFQDKLRESPQTSPKMIQGPMRVVAINPNEDEIVICSLENLIDLFHKQQRFNLEKISAKEAALAISKNAIRVTQVKALIEGILEKSAVSGVDYVALLDCHRHLAALDGKCRNLERCKREVFINRIIAKQKLVKVVMSSLNRQKVFKDLNDPLTLIRIFEEKLEEKIEDLLDHFERSNKLGMQNELVQEQRFNLALSYLVKNLNDLVREFNYDIYIKSNYHDNVESINSLISDFDKMKKTIKVSNHVPVLWEGKWQPSEENIKKLQNESDYFNIMRDRTFTLIKFLEGIIPRSKRIVDGIAKLTVLIGKMEKNMSLCNEVKNGLQNEYLDGELKKAFFKAYTEESLPLKQLIEECEKMMTIRKLIPSESDLREENELDRQDSLKKKLDRQVTIEQALDLLIIAEESQAEESHALLNLLTFCQTLKKQWEKINVEKMALEKLAQDQLRSASELQGADKKTSWINLIDVSALIKNAPELVSDETAAPQAAGDSAAASFTTQILDRFTPRLHRWKRSRNLVEAAGVKFNSLEASSLTSSKSATKTSQKALSVSSEFFFEKDDSNLMILLLKGICGYNVVKNSALKQLHRETRRELIEYYHLNSLEDVNLLCRDIQQTFFRVWDLAIQHKLISAPIPLFKVDVSNHSDSLLFRLIKAIKETKIVSNPEILVNNVLGL